MIVKVDEEEFDLRIDGKAIRIRSISVGVHCGSYYMFGDEPMYIWHGSRTTYHNNSGGTMPSELLQYCQRIKDNWVFS